MFLNCETILNRWHLHRLQFLSPAMQQFTSHSCPLGIPIAFQVTCDGSSNYLLLNILDFHTSLACNMNTDMKIKYGSVQRVKWSDDYVILWSVIEGEHKTAQWSMHLPDSPLGYFVLYPVLHSWCNKGCDIYYPVFGIIYKKIPCR